jgi:hypothetical protein
MEPPVNLDRKLRDLAFELEESQGPIFLIAVSDDASQRATLSVELNRELSRSSKNMIYVPAGSLKDDLMGAFRVLRRKQKLVQNSKARQMRWSISSEFCSLGIEGERTQKLHSLIVR